MEPLERRYFGDDDRDRRERAREARERRRDVGYEFGPGPDGDAVLGPHTGVGPRGYQRADGRIREDVCQWLTDDGRLDASGIEVEVTNGDVTLRGTVQDRHARRLAEDIAHAVPGVRDVFCRLSVGPRAA
jgi:hypothetical protein